MANERTASSRAMLILCYLAFLGVIPLFFARDDPEVRWHARNGLLLFGASFGLALLTNDRKTSGLVLSMSVIARYPPSRASGPVTTTSAGSFAVSRRICGTRTRPCPSIAASWP